MTEQALQDLLGTTVLNDYRLDLLVRINDALATYVATCTTDGSGCTVRIALKLEVSEHQEASLHSALTRIARHAVGIRGLAPPRSAGVVEIEGVRRLAVAHGGEPKPCAEERIATGQAASFDEMLALLEPLGSSLGALHDQGIVHGAIHSAALRFDPAGTTLSAFGLSELATVVGGPAAARDVVPARARTPEQVGVVPASPSPESDTYAVAVIAVELLAGRPFTDAQDEREVVAAVEQSMRRPTPRALGVRVNDVAEQVFAKALRTDPRSRTSDPRELLQALSRSRFETEAAQEGEQEPHRSTPPPAEEPASTSGFEPPPKAQAPRPRASNFYPPPPPDPTKTKSNAWIVYVLVGLGFLLLVGGVGALFVHILQAPTPVAATTTTPPPPPTPPPLAPTATAPSVDAGRVEAGPQDAGPSAPRDGGAPRTWAHADAGASVYPADAIALVPIDEDTIVVGSRDALVTIVLFADMQCPYTRRARLAIERLLAQFDSDLRVAVRHLPLSEHADAEAAAEAATGTYMLGGASAFWTFFEKATENQASLTRANLLTWAVGTGVDQTKLETGMDAGTYLAIVKRDLQLAGQLMVRATPTFFINGRRFNGMQSQSNLADAVDSERMAARVVLSSGTRPEVLYKKRVVFNMTSAAADRRRR